jgi:protein ImuB
MRRILSMWLPSGPILRLRRLGIGKPDRPLATVETVRGVRHLAAVSPEAAALGLRPEQTLAQARAICPGLEVVEADPAADQAALAALAGWCERFTPLAAADAPDGLWLDITGCAHLFGDEAGLAAALAARIDRAGLNCRIAVASTPGAAWALARTALRQDAPIILPRGAEAAALGTLPVALLRLDERTVARLRRVGLRTIAELARQPRGELSARFGSLPVLRLDQALDRAAEAIAWPRPPRPWSERLAFAEPIGTPEDLARALDLLAQRLCARLAAARRGGHAFTARFFRVDGQCPPIAIGTALPVRDPAYVAKLLRGKLETVDPGFGVEAVLLEADETAPLLPPQQGLATLAQPPETSTTLAETVDALANRLGGDHLWRDTPFPSHVPERTTRPIAPLAPHTVGWNATTPAERPLRLLSRPEPITATALLPDDPPMQFTWRGAVHRVRAATGPERIGAEWWRRTPSEARAEHDMLRDYYRLEDSEGTRFWVFRAGMDTPIRWFLHGIFG